MLTIFENINWFLNLQFRNYWNIGYGGDRNFEFYDDLDTRGGPPIIKPAKNFYFFNVNSDSRKRWGFGLSHSGNNDSAGGVQKNYNANLRLQPSGRLQANISVNATRARDSA